jgi:ribosomal RNA assembly protein
MPKNTKKNALKEESLNLESEKTSKKASKKTDESVSEQTDDLSDEESYSGNPVFDKNYDVNEFSYALKIPRDRIAALIGVKGKDKRELEEYAHAKIIVDSKEGDITITGSEAIKLYELREIIKAISRGFSPEAAKQLLKSDFMLQIMSLRDYDLDSPNKLARIRARLIGTGGKARRTLETLTQTNISVYGKTIGIIGECGAVSNAKRAIEMLISGSMHATVYKWLEKARRKSREEEKGF